MQRDNHGFFYQIQRQEITGNKIKLGKRNEKLAIDLINNLNLETELSNQLIYLDQIKKLALLNVKTALRFYKESCENVIFKEMEINISMSAAYEEIGRIHENPEFLCEAFYRYSGFPEHNPMLEFPSIQKAFECLDSARRMKGSGATFASYVFAYLYSGELGLYNFYCSHRLGTLSDFYYEFMKPLLNLTSDDKYEIKKTKNIDYDIIRLEGEIFFANMGCRDAINNLIEWYEDGNEELNIVKNQEECNQWQQKLEKLSEFLMEKYREHFEIALENTKKYGYCDAYHNRAPGYLDYKAPKHYLPVDILYFINAMAQLSYNVNPFELQKHYKQEFIAEADSGNISACLYLAYYELRCHSPEAAKIWYKKILETNYSIYINMPYEITTAARSCWEIAMEEKLPESETDNLLKKAADLGCWKSALLFANKCLEKNSNAEAIKYFDLVMKNSHVDIPKKISDILKNVPELETYRLFILGEGVKRNCTSCLETLQKINNSWNEIHGLMQKKMLVDDDKIDELITKMIRNYSECIFGQIRRLSM